MPLIDKNKTDEFIKEFVLGFLVVVGLYVLALVINWLLHSLRVLH